MDYDLILPSVFCCSNCSSFNYWQLFLVTSLLLWHPYLCLFLRTINIYHYKMVHSHQVYFLSQPRVSHFFRNSGSFYRQMFFFIREWVPSRLIVTGLSVLLGALSWQSKEIYVYILTSTHTYLYKYFCYICTCLF